MNYEDAAKRLLECRRELEKLDAEHKAAKAKWVERETALENWFSAKALEDGLENVKTSVGVAYWSAHGSAKVASREALFSHCKDNDSWDLVEARASLSGVKAYIEANGVPPPGVDFKSRRVFNFRVVAADSEIKLEQST